MEAIIYNCLLCGGKLFYEEKIGKFNKKVGYLICINCATAYLDKRFKQDIYSYYSKDYEKWFQQDDSIALKNSFRDSAPRVFLVKSFIKTKKKYIFEIGCGIATTLLLFKLTGSLVCGIEPSEKYSAFNRDVLNLEVSSLFIDKYTYKKKYDIITMFGVIEHLANPLETLKSLRGLIKYDGYLFFTTPHIKKINNSIIFQQSHNILFSAHSFEILLQKAGFFLERIVLFGGSMNIFARVINKKSKSIYPAKSLFSSAKFLEDYSFLEKFLLQWRYIIFMIFKLPLLIYLFIILKYKYHKIIQEKDKKVLL